MNIIDLYPFKIVISGKEAFLLPGNNWRDPGYLVLRKELAVVEYQGCLCGECIRDDIRASEKEVANILADRGITSVQHSRIEGDAMQADIDLACETLGMYVTIRYNKTYEPSATSDHFCFRRLERGDGSPIPSFESPHSLLRWVLQQPEILFDVEESWAVNPARIVKVCEWLVSDWMPSMEYAVALQKYDRGDLEITPWRFVFPDEWRKYLP